MEFDSLIDAERFYYTYAHGMGFSIRRGKLRKNLQGELTRRALLCGKQGYREDKYFHLLNRKRNPKLLSRCGCEARFRVVYKRLQKKWQVVAFNAEHNHNLALRAHRHYLRHVDDGSLKETLVMKSSGIRPYYKVRMDNKLFGDVIAFNTTYNKNSYNMPLLSPKGVNNHNLTIVFGFALISNETKETFQWVLQAFAEVMGNKLPKSVVTDGDRSMHNAIEEIFPNA
ncbi:hypothetical protein COLO4_26685 [Corchorus olitorius]|uniref:Uncharacterized protein n=1 Tax=Corchorus olitorius TaxID=93759 RepID=A0A1R3HV67_9ROSI|nr:hypothetical protein COLO4_26685 [Corchorus olitorius]